MNLDRYGVLRVCVLSAVPAVLRRHFYALSLMPAAAAATQTKVFATLDDETPLPETAKWTANNQNQISIGTATDKWLEGVTSCTVYLGVRCAACGVGVHARA